MRARRVGPLGTVGILLFLSANAAAQLPISLGLRVGESLTLSPEVEGRGGISFDIFAAYRIRPTLSVYLMSGGTDLGEFKPEQSIDLSSYSLSAGVESTFGRLSVGSPKPFFQAGLGLYSLSASQLYSDIGVPLDELSPTRIGIDLSVGVTAALTSRWYVTPAVRFVTFAADWTFGYDDVSATERVSYATVDRVSYAILDVGLRYNFGVRDVR